MLLLMQSLKYYITPLLAFQAALLDRQVPRLIITTEAVDTASIIPIF
jgi:hypothetical protein